MAWACRDSDRRVMARTHTEMASHLRSDRRRADPREVQRVPQPCCLKEKRERHCHPTARAPSRASLSSDRPRSLFLALLKKVKTILVHCAHRLLSKLARILCTLRTRPFARALRSHCPRHRKRGSQRRVSGCKDGQHLVYDTEWSRHISALACAECLIPPSTDTMQEGRIDDQFAKRINGPHVEWREAAYAADIDP